MTTGFGTFPSFWRIACAFAALVLTVGAFGTQAEARDRLPAEHWDVPYSGKIPACDHPRVLARIVRKFRSRERTYWHTGREIRHIYRVRQIGYRTNGRDFIPRRYCTARAKMNTGRKRRITFWIGEDTGIIGATWGVTWCVHGLDYEYAFAPWCKAARP